MIGHTYQNPDLTCIGFFRCSCAINGDCQFPETDDQGRTRQDVSELGPIAFGQTTYALVAGVLTGVS